MTGRDGFGARFDDCLYPRVEYGAGKTVGSRIVTDRLMTQQTLGAVLEVVVQRRRLHNLQPGQGQYHEADEPELFWVAPHSHQYYCRFGRTIIKHLIWIVT